MFTESEREERGEGRRECAREGKRERAYSNADSSNVHKSMLLRALGDQPRRRKPAFEFVTDDKASFKLCVWWLQSHLCRRI
jgi:hypothetical protein